MKRGVDLPIVRVDERELVFTQGDATAQSLEIDQLIVASGVEPAPSLAASLRAAGHEVHEIGDVTGVGYIEGAVRDGFQLGLRL